MKIRFHKQNFWPYLLGMIAAQNVFYFFKFGNTYLNIAQVIPFFVLAYNFLMHPSKVQKAFRECNRYVLLFYAVMVLSVFNVMYIAVKVHLEDSLRTYVVGLIAGFLGFCYYLDIIYYRKRTDALLRGLAAGFGLNILVCMIAYVAFYRGTYFGFANLFPQPSFFTSVQWESRSIVPELRAAIYYFRAQGLFLESSHYVAFFTVAVFLLLAGGHFGKIWKKAGLLIGLYLLIISRTGTIAALAVCGILYMIPMDQLRTRVKRRYVIWGITGVLSLLVLFCIFHEQFSQIFGTLMESLISANIFNKENSLRFMYMQNAIDCIFRFPFGLGVNMSPMVLKHFYGSSTAFSYLLTVILELGPIGLIVYGAVYFDLFISLYRNRSNKFTYAVFVSLVGALLTQTANGFSFSSAFVLLIVALGQCEKLKISENVEGN